MGSLNIGDYNSTSEVVINLDGSTRVWKHDQRRSWQSDIKEMLPINGMYEGSLFYGSRFNDSRLVDSILSDGRIASSDIVDADDYVKEKLSFILHGENGNFPGLKKLRNRDIATRLGLVNTPYFNDVNGRHISQYRMSSGECLLITLLHFVYNAIVRRSLPKSQFILTLIDEIEVALHPIAVHRFLETINELVESNENLMVILTSHSPEVIRRIDPKNIYKIENHKGQITVINPAYPSYVIRDIYKHDGFDRLILTEDTLAKIVTQKIIDRHRFANSKLVHIVPSGGWENVLRLHHDLLMGNVLGVDRQIFSIIDGDVKDNIPDKYKNLKKFFLPIESVEKFLLDVCVKKKNEDLKKIIGDKYFTVTSIGELVAQHNKQYPKGTSSESKKFYFRLICDLKNRGISEEVFVEKLASDIIEKVDFGRFAEQLGNALS